MYTFNSRVRFSETDEKSKLTLEAIVDYFQDCSTFQSEDLEVGFSYLTPMHMTWVLSYWQIIVEEYPALGEEITIGTIPYEFKGFLGRRNFSMTDSKGNRTAVADTLWTLLDTEKMLPARVTQKMLERYPVEEKMEMDYAPRKIKISGEERAEDLFVIQKHHLDRNGHVNNGQYIKLASVYLPQDFKVYQMRAEYKVQAHLNDTVYPYVYEENNKITVSLNDADKKPYAVVEFSVK